MAVEASTSDEIGIPSIDSLFLEETFASRWQKLELALCSLAIMHLGYWMFSPAFYRFDVPYTCADQILKDVANESTTEQVSAIFDQFLSI